jgi:hypothetical protein
MFGKRKNTRELDPPPQAQGDPEASEVMRVWAVPEQGQVVALRTTWKDPGAWGLMLVDVARHAANAYANEGMPRTEALARIKALFDAEWSSPTDDAREIKPQ